MSLRISQNELFTLVNPRQACSFTVPPTIIPTSGFFLLFFFSRKISPFLYIKFLQSLQSITSSVSSGKFPWAQPQGCFVIFLLNAGFCSPGAVSLGLITDYLVALGKLLSFSDIWFSYLCRRGNDSNCFIKVLVRIK